MVPGTGPIMPDPDTDLSIKDDSTPCDIPSGWGEISDPSRGLRLDDIVVGGV